MPAPSSSDVFAAGAAAALRVLVADDDPASRRFLGDALRHLGLAAETCADGGAALALARGERFDLLLLDRRMPGGGAREVLGRLRGDDAAASTASLAMATSAECSQAERRALLEAGFSEVLLKPCTVDDLRYVVALVRPEGRPHAALLDDEAALASSGDLATLHALRGLLREELATLHRELDRLGDDATGFAERLHRLRSACGFCGADALAVQAMRLQRQLARGMEDDGCLPRFRQTLLATLQALGAPE
ncbi:response regulator [Frateuria defendens]|uniref:response regulator n=1 Tax=Frateuria defendens TaxID=2219559 RepID=UPI00066FFBEF|nr:response regulator [Frateuria defendens]